MWSYPVFNVKLFALYLAKGLAVCTLIKLCSKSQNKRARIRMYITVLFLEVSAVQQSMLLPKPRYEWNDVPF